MWVSACWADEDVIVEPMDDSILLSNIYLWKGDQYLRQRQIDQATESYLKASRYLRASPDPHFALARVYTRRSIVDAFLEFATGVKLLLSDFFYQSLVVSNLLVIIVASIGASVYIAVLVIIVRHAKTLWLSAVISLPSGLKGSYPQVIIMASVLSFFLLLSGRSLISIATWAAIVGCALVWRFASASEKRTIVGFAIFLVVIGFALSFVGQVLSTQHPESALRMAAIADRIGQERLERAFTSDQRSSQYDPTGDFMRGYLHLKAGQYDLAIERLNVASKFAPSNPAILNNLGAAFHGLGRYQTAKGKFQEALRSAPREAVIHYNYSQTLNALLHYDLAQEELAEASALDFDLTRSLVTRKEEAAPVPMSLQTRVLWQMAVESENEMLALSYHPAETGVTGTLILILVVALSIGLMRKAKCPARCEVCGCDIETQLTRRKRKDLLCADCHEIKVESGNDNKQLELDYEDRLKKLRMRSMIVRLVAGLVVPGSTYHLSGKRFKGFMLSIALVSLALLAISGGSPVERIPRLNSTEGTSWLIPALIVVYALYAWRSSVLAVRSMRET
jgi:tetratricopeptide (TPR) repeat protein